MKKLNNYLSIIGLGWLFKVSVIISSLLLIAGFFVPPMGVIHGSVLIGVGEIGLIINIPVFFAFASNKHIKIKGDLDEKSIELTTKPNNKKKRELNYDRLYFSNYIFSHHPSIFQGCLYGGWRG
jgi:hypothetical protein